MVGGTASVTGGTSGIGAATATAAAREGAAVVVAGRRTDEGDAVARSIASDGGTAAFVRADVTVEHDVANLVAETVRRFGRLDAAFDNAGTVSAFGTIEQQTLDGWRAELDTNATSAFLCLKHQVPAMLDSGGGSIVLNASQLGVVGIGAGVVPYVAAKHAVVALTRAAALELATRGVRVNALVLAGVDTPLFRSTMGATPESAAHVASLHPMGRVATPEEVAPLVVFLASDASSFITGSAIAIDGGWTAQ